MTQNPPLNQNQGKMVATILTEPKTKDLDVSIVTRGGATNGENGTQTQVRLAVNKKVAFDIATEKETIFETRDVIRRNLGKSPVYEMPFAFDSSRTIAAEWYLA